MILDDSELAPSYLRKDITSEKSTLDAIKDTNFFWILSKPAMVALHMVVAFVAVLSSSVKAVAIYGQCSVLVLLTIRNDSNYYAASNGIGYDIPATIRWRYRIYGLYNL